MNDNFPFSTQQRDYFKDTAHSFQVKQNPHFSSYHESFMVPKPVSQYRNQLIKETPIFTPIKKRHPMLDIKVDFPLQYHEKWITPIIPGSLYLSCGEMVNKCAEGNSLQCPLSKKNIRHILNVTKANSVGVHLPKNYKSYYYYRIPVDDDPNERLFEYFISAVQLLDSWISSGNAVVVHCVMGISRSCSIILAYLIYKYHMTTEEALLYVKKRRPIVNPNHGFLAQLQEFEKFIK